MTIDNVTTNLGLPLPNADNDLSVDVVRIQQTFSTADVNVFELTKRIYNSFGYKLVSGSFETGGVLQYPTDCLLSSGLGKVFRWDGSFPKIVGAGMLPDEGWTDLSEIPVPADRLLNKNGGNVQQDIDDWKAFTDTLASAAGIDPITTPDTPGDSKRVVAIQALPKPASTIKAEVVAGVERDLLSRARDTINIFDHGGVDDNDGTLLTTNNLSAFSSAFTQLNLMGGGKLYLPKKQTGQYLINGDDTTPVYYPVEIVADEGVSLRIVYSGGISNSPFANNDLLKYNRELLKVQHNFGFSTYGHPFVKKRPSSTLPTLTQTQGVYSKPKSLSGSDFVVVNLSDPDNTEAPISSSSDSISFDGTGKTIAALRNCKVNQEIFALMSNSVSGVFFAGVKTLNGYAYYSQSSATQAVTLVEAVTGEPALIQGVPRALLNQQRDLFNNSLMSVRVISERKFSVLCNGLVVGTYNTKSNITGVMMGTENISGTTYISQPSLVLSNSTGGSKPLRIIGVGDSISDNNVQYSPFRVMASILQSQGIQLSELNNIAVAGQKVAEQLAILQTIGVGYDFCLIQIGVNDIQGLTDITAFSNSIVAMCNYCKSVGTIAIVGIPTQYYSKAEANAHGQTGGQNTTYNEVGHTYRSILIRAVANAGALINLQSMKNYGPVTASWLDASVTGVEIDPIVVDNIHPTPYAVNMLGLGLAESIVGALHQFDDTNHVPFELVPPSWMRNGFGVNSRPSLKASVITGTVDLLDLVDSNVPEGTPFMQLPKHLWPAVTKYSSATPILSNGNPSGSANVMFGPDGNVYAFNLPVDTVSIHLDLIDLSDVVFHLI
jgi:hypothetical protein